MKKRWISALLLLAMLLAGCAGATENTSSDGESTIPPENLPAWQNRVQQIDALYGEEASRLGKAPISLSEGKTVTASREASKELSLLTDGSFCDPNTKKGTLKFSGKEELTLIVDLGEVTDGIYDMGLGLFYATGEKASVPKSVNFYVSDDGESYLLVGTAYRAADVDNNSPHKITLCLQNTISARYVKAVIESDAFLSDNTLMDEFFVYTYGDAPEAPVQDAFYDAYYNNPPLPEITEDLFWDKSEADYAKEQNLVAKKEYRIKSTMKVDAQFQTDYYNSPITNKALTNGITGGNSFGDGAYFHFTRFVGRTIIFDLEKVSGVSSATVGFLMDKEPGITLPESVSVLGSMDGVKWGELAVGTPTTTKTGAHRVSFTLEFDKTAVRFVAIKTGVNSHLWMDEITVTGTKSAEGAKKLEVKETENAMPNEYLSKDALGGVENIILMYNYKTENPASGLNTAEKQLIYAAYHNGKGEIVDTFFDSFLYLPCSTVCPSGGHLYYDAKNPSRASDWLDYEEDLFHADANVPALSQAVATMDEALGTDTEMSVFLSIFSTVYGDKGFGDIQGEINGVDFTNIEDRKKVLKWWIDRMIDRFESGGYDNLRLDGFYWYHEAIETSDPHEVELLKFTADYLHSKGYYFIWIPYYQSSGFATWKSYGFDAAVMQPNYMFNDNIPESRLYDNAEYTKQLGLGVEIEADYGVLSSPDKREKYRDYLRVGVETGYMHSIKMYYQDAGVYYNAYKSSDSYYHSVYDETYRYAKGTLTFGIPELESTVFRGKQDKSFAIFLDAKDDTVVTAELVASPKYGAVRIANNGRIYYYPAEGFVGEDTFIIRDASNEKDPGTLITVVIEEAEEKE